jgi:xylose isomerase
VWAMPLELSHAIASEHQKQPDFTYTTIFNVKGALDTERDGQQASWEVSQIIGH